MKLLLLLHIVLISYLADSQVLRFHKNSLQKQKKNFILTPFFTPGYTPDLKFTLAGGAILSFKTDKNDSLLKRSSIPISVVYSTTDAIGIFTNYTIFFKHDTYRLFASALYRKQRDSYFGIGYANATSTSFPDSTFNKKQYYLLQAKLLRKVLPDFYMGIIMDINSTNISIANAHMRRDPYFLKFGPINTNIGSGIIMSYDTRDYPQNAFKGIYATTFFNTYSTFLGSKNEYNLLDIDFRKFIPLSIQTSKTLAINWHSKYFNGDVPYSEMATIGLPFDLRGYLPNQFRDTHLNYFITEYRSRIYLHAKQTKLGYVTWVGIGSISNSFKEALFKNPLPNIGIGLRYEIQKRLNVRCDWGFGKFTNEIYFSFQEAF